MKLKKKLVNNYGLIHNKVFLMTGVTLSLFWGLSSSSFFMLWCSLELNTLWFLGVLWLEGGNSSLMKYFFVQGLGSLMLVWGIFSSISFLLLVGGFMKLGLFPFHVWGLDLSSEVSWFSWLVLMSLQKLLPILVLLNVTSLSVNLMFLCVCNLLVSCVGSFHKSSLKILMFYSSLFNMGLMVLLVDYGFVMMTLFFLYCLTLLPCWSILQCDSITNVQQLGFNVEVLLMYLSLGGFPPSVGFIFKWSVFEYLLLHGYGLYLMVPCILLSLYMFYIYFLIIVNSYLKSSSLVAYSNWEAGALLSGLQLLAPGLLLLMY